jgi:peptidoglycan biosynthesis protein MviN/MurJ (putative lipid II flippase)
MRVAAIGLVVNSIVTYFLVSWFSAVGAAMGTIIGGGVATCCYLYFAMSQREVMHTLALGMRVAMAALLMGFVVYSIRESAWLILIPVCLIVYIPMLFVVGAVRVSDIRFFQTLFLKRASS